MTKAFRKLISLTVCLMMVLGTVAVGGCGLSELLDNFAVNANAEETGYEAGDIIEFGSYPQTKVEDAVLISSLNKLGGDNTTWTSYNYYSGTGDCDDGQMTSSDYMRYKDVIYGTAKYRGVVFDSYRPYCTGDTSSTSYIYQYDNGYSTGTTYWFKYEPIKWKVLDPATGLVLSDAILDSQPYNNYIWYGVGGSSTSKEYYGDEAHTYYANNYAESSIRDWLNDDFCNTAFSDNQQNIIKSTVLDNSAYSTSYSAYDSVSTKDKIYLLSYSDALNSSYGFSTSRDSSPTRTAQGTDYAKCQGLYVYSGNSRWRLRSASYYSYSACGVDYVGDVGDYYGTYLTGYGVRAALNLNLESEIFKSEITLDANNGTGDTAEQTVTKFKSFYPECTFTNKGYVFKGWYIDKDCTEVWTEKDVVNGNMTLYAKWKAHTYGEWVTVKDSTCTEVGFKMRTCTDCGFIETSNINTSDHEWEDGYTVDKEPTYSEAGSESIHCKHCEAVKDSRSIISISEKFEIEKANVIASLNESGETQDNQYSQNITNEAIQDINNYVYDESKSFEENVKEINAIENVATYKVNTYDNTVNACPFLRFLAKIFETVISFFSKLFG